MQPRIHSTAAIAATESTALLQVIVSFATTLGVDRARLLAQAGTTDAALESDTRLIVGLSERLLNAAIHLSGNSDFGLLVGESTPVGPTNVLDYVFYSASNLLEGLRRSSRFQRLLTDQGYCQILESSDPPILRLITHDPRRIWPRQNSEWAISAFWTRMRRFAGDQLDAVSIHFQHREPKCLDSHRRIFGCPIKFESEFNEIVVSREALSSKNGIGQSDPALHEILIRYAQQQLDELGDADRFVSALRESIAYELRGGAPRLAPVAKALGLSTRGLQRKLQESDLTFVEVTNRIRETFAANYLTDTELSVNEIAFLLGFSERESFHRAFRRWYGTTPIEYRGSSRTARYL